MSETKTNTSPFPSDLTQFKTDFWNTMTDNCRHRELTHEERLTISVVSAAFDALSYWKTNGCHEELESRRREAFKDQLLSAVVDVVS
jgi:hypothetical protein